MAVDIQYNFTAGEAEDFIEKMILMKVMQPPVANAESRLSLRQRQLEELELGAFEDEPDFRQALYKLCEETKNPDDFAFGLQMVRQRFKRPMIAQDFIDGAIDRAQNRWYTPPSDRTMRR